MYWGLNAEAPTTRSATLRLCNDGLQKLAVRCSNTAAKRGERNHVQTDARTGLLAAIRRDDRGGWRGGGGGALASAVGHVAGGNQFGNGVLAQRGPDGEARGVSADLARELARRLGLGLQFVPYDGAGFVTDAAASGAWDVCFLAVDPRRAEQIDFTAPYVLIEGAYLVPQASALRDVASVDQEGIRVMVDRGSAYDLFLQRTLKQRDAGLSAAGARAGDYYLEAPVEVLAGVKQPLQQMVEAHAGLRMVPGRFMQIAQAMGAVHGRDAGFAYLQRFVAEMKGVRVYCGSACGERAGGGGGGALREMGLWGVALADCASLIRPTGVTGRFMQIARAMRGLQRFVAEIKPSGFVAARLAASGQVEAEVALEGDGALGRCVGGLRFAYPPYGWGWVGVGGCASGVGRILGLRLDRAFRARPRLAPTSVRSPWEARYRPGTRPGRSTMSTRSQPGRSACWVRLPSRAVRVMRRVESDSRITSLARTARALWRSSRMAVAISTPLKPATGHRRRATRTWP